MTLKSLEIVIEEGIAIWKFNDEITFDNSNELKEESKRILANKDSNNLIIDLSQVPYIDSSGIGFVFSLFKFMRNRGGTVVIANANEKIKKVFEITKMKKVIKIYDNLEDAIKQLGD